MEALRDMKLPVGFGFHPSDTELVSHYLKRKILGQKIEDGLIPEVDIYKHEPWDLPAKCNFPVEDNKWHFFASRDRKYPTGARSNRATIAGYWKSTGKDRAIKLRNRTLGTKKTLVFHQGRPPSGKRTEWIMHEYYIDESECRANPDMKDAFVLCRVTKRTDWALENDNEGSNRNPQPQQPNAAASTSVATAENHNDVAAEEPNHVATPVAGAELSNHVATPVASAEISNPVAAQVASAELSNNAAAGATTSGSQNEGSDLEAWLDELICSPYDVIMDTGSTAPCLTEHGPIEYAELLVERNPGSVAQKMESDHANGIDDTDYLLTGDIRSLFEPNIDGFNGLFPEPADQAGVVSATDQTFPMVGIDPSTLPNNSGNEIWKGELQSHQGNNNPNPSNDYADNGITIRRRNPTASAANIRSSAQRIKLQVGKKMVTSNTESINQTLQFKDNNGRLDLLTNSDHQRELPNDGIPAKPSDAAKSNEGNSGPRHFRNIKHVWRCSSAAFNVLFAVCAVGVAAVVLHGNHRGFSS